MRDNVNMNDREISSDGRERMSWLKAVSRDRPVKLQILQDIY
jgi:hypothetical protein